MNVSSVRKLTLSECEKDGTSSVWVTNNTNPPGNINLSMQIGSESVAIVIPMTWIPFDVTTQTTKSSIIVNPQFRRLVSTGTLSLISEDDAELILKDSSAQEEYARLFKGSNSSSTQPEKPEIKTLLEEDTISGFVLNLTHREDITENICLNALRSQEKILTKTDLAFLLKNVKFAGVKTWASNKLNEI